MALYILIMISQREVSNRCSSLSRLIDNKLIHLRSISGHERTFCGAIVMSALPPKADICSALTHVRFVPIADIPTPAIGVRYSIRRGSLPQGDQRFLGRFVSTGFLKRIGGEQSFHMAALRSNYWSTWQLSDTNWKPFGVAANQCSRP